MITYSHQQPTEPGWYWCRNEHEDKHVIWEAVVRVERNARGLFCTWLTLPGYASVMYVEDWSPLSLWSGPLTPPTNPQHN